MSLFNEFDMNGDGFINASELREGLRKRGIAGNVGRMISDADEDGNARIDVEEFRKILSLHEDKTIEKKKKKCCACQNCTCIDCKCSKSNGPGCDPCASFMSKKKSDADEDGNARIDVEEFRKILSLHEDKTIEKKKKKCCACQNCTCIDCKCSKSNGPGCDPCASFMSKKKSEEKKNEIVSPPSLRCELKGRRFSAASMRSAMSLEDAPSRHNSIAIREEPHTIEMPGCVKTRSLRREEKIAVSSPSSVTPIPPTRQFSQDINREVMAIMGQDALERSIMKSGIKIRESAGPFMRETRQFFYIIKKMSDRAGISEACHVLREYHRHLVHDEPTKRSLRPFLVWVDKFEAEFGLFGR
eukprot:g6703.t1